MAVTRESELTPRQRESIKKARQAAQRDNFDYVVTLLQQLLKEVPGYLDGRKLLRETCIRKSKAGSRIMQSLSSLSTAPAIMKAQGLAKKNGQEALNVLEQVLVDDPFNEQANSLMSQIARDLDMAETACFAHEILQRAKPNDIPNLLLLGKLYLELRDPRALEVFEAVLDVDPRNNDALSNLKAAEAIRTMERVGWGEAGDYRQLIKDSDEAEQLEQTARISKSHDAIDKLIAEHYDRFQADPNNVLEARKIGELYRQKGDLPNALAFYEHAHELANKADPHIERTIFEIRVQQYDELIKQWEHFVAENPDHPDHAQHAQTLETNRKERADLVLSEARARVAKYPNDLQFRFELGEALFNAGQHSDAIPELQAALRQPNVRVRAMTLLSLCFRAKGMLDMAAKRLEEADAELRAMDDSKKDILYNLGLIYEDMGDKAKAIDAFKKIYEVDYGYRDVARRVEDSYRA
ncbi:MAG: tetratricopeptide repeat protein [Verrucomicrobiae bacterium]|nr:tetratricopeptide repeat protein [Verrucomicrobiae bacterium]